MSDHLSGSSHSHRPLSRLVVAPHAGDETVGCGGTLAKHDDDSAVVVLAKLDEDRAMRFKAAIRMLGDPVSFTFDLPGRDLVDDMDQLVGMLTDLLALIRPAELYLPFPSPHPDHLAAYEAGRRSLRMPLTHDVWPMPSVLLYDMGCDVTQYAADVRWNVCEPLEESDVDRKVAAALVYRSPAAHGLKRCAQDVGSSRQLPWAEQFALIHAPRGTEARRPGSRPEGDPAMVGSLR